MHRICNDTSVLLVDKICLLISKQLTARQFIDRKLFITGVHFFCLYNYFPS